MTNDMMCEDCKNESICRKCGTNHVSEFIKDKDRALQELRENFKRISICRYLLTKVN